MRCLSAFRIRHPCPLVYKQQSRVFSSFRSLKGERSFVPLLQFEPCAKRFLDGPSQVKRLFSTIPDKEVKQTKQAKRSFFVQVDMIVELVAACIKVFFITYTTMSVILLLLSIIVFY